MTEPVVDSLRDRNGYLATDTCVPIAPGHDLRPSAHTALRRGILCASLEVAVPMWISRMRRLDLSEIVQVGQACVDGIASGGDNAIYRGATKQETADAFNTLARGLAALAYTPGGVRFLDCHWDANGGIAA